MARQRGQVQLEQSNLCLLLNMAKMAKEGFLRAAIEDTKYLTKKPWTEVREEKKRGVEFPAHKKVNAAIQRHPAMLRQSQTSGCPPCHNGTTKHPHSGWRRTGTGAPPPDRRSERTPELTPPLPGTSATPTTNISGVRPSQIINLHTGYTYSNTALRSTEFFDDQETEHAPDFDPDILTDER